MIHRLCVSTALVDKATRTEFNDLSRKLTAVEFTVDQLIDHLAVKGHPICTADLTADKTTGYARRNRESFISSSIVGLDMDHDTKPFRTLESDPFFSKYASFAYTTASHTEQAPRYRIMFVLDEPIRNVDQYKALTTALVQRFGGDSNARDAVRLWFGKKRAELITWGNTLPPEQVARLVESEGKAEEEEVKLRAFGTKPLTTEDVRAMLSFIPAQLDHIDWKRVCAAVVDAVGESEAVPLLKHWSPSDTPYERVVGNRLKQVRAGTLVYFAKKHGYEPPASMYVEPTKDSIEILDRIETYLCAKYEFRKNATTNAVEYREELSSSWERVTDYWAHSVLRRMRSHGLKIAKERLWEVLDSDFAPVYEPVSEYFKNLPEWRQGDDDCISKLVDLLPDDPAMPSGPQREYRLKVLRCWLIGAVACALDNKPNHLMLILQGGQGVGKTSFLRYLCPAELRKDHYYEGSISDDRDCMVAISRSFIIVDDELESITKRESEMIKSLITSGERRVRLPYARTEVTLPRRGSFAGSVNRRNFLTDDTGSRRFPVIAVGGSIRLADLHSIDVDRVWAQAHSLYKEGYQYWLSERDIELVNQTNAQFAITTEADDLVWRYIENAAGDQKTYMTTTEVTGAICERFFQDTQARLNTSNLVWAVGRALGKANYDQVVAKSDGRTFRGWKVRIRATPRTATTFQNEGGKVLSLAESVGF